jgi:hypothetical protein
MISEQPLTTGASWTAKGKGPVSGRYPLAVERHVLGQVDRLLPGITTVTPHARYYSLHAFVAEEIERRAMKIEDAKTFLRRCEVVLGAISILHAQKDAHAHEGLPAAHGVDKILAALAEGQLETRSLAAPRGYSQSEWGFLSPYVSSESLTGLLTVTSGEVKNRWTAGGLLTGPRADASALAASFGDLVTLVRHDELSLETLQENSHLCLCRTGVSPDGAMLRNVLIDADAPELQVAGRRFGTIRLLLRLIEHAPPNRPNVDLAPLVAFGDLLTTDPIIASMPISEAWRGVTLRRYSVTAWRSLWAMLVNNLQGLTPRSAMADPLLDLLPGGTVRDFIASLPASFDSLGNPAGAEVSTEVSELENGVRELAMLLIGAQRAGHLSDRVTPYFESPDEQGHDLTPSWTQARILEWNERPLRDFTATLVDQLIARSQRVAISKSRLDRKTGVISVPSRVFLRDDFIFRDSKEGGGPVGLRWNQLVTILGPLGLLERVDDLWHLTDMGRSYVK